MDGWQRAIQGRSPSQFLQGHVGLAAQQLTKGLALSGDFAGLEPAPMIPRADVPAVTALLQEFLDHAQRDSEAVGDLLSSPFLLIVRNQDAFPQIQRYRSHEQTLPRSTVMATTLFKML